MSNSYTLFALNLGYASSSGIIDNPIDHPSILSDLVWLHDTTRKGIKNLKYLKTMFLSNKENKNLISENINYFLKLISDDKSKKKLFVLSLNCHSENRNNENIFHIGEGETITGEEINEKLMRINELATVLVLLNSCDILGSNELDPQIGGLSDFPFVLPPTQGSYITLNDILKNNSKSLPLNQKVISFINTISYTKLFKTNNKSSVTENKLNIDLKNIQTNHQYPFIKVFNKNAFTYNNPYGEINAEFGSKLISAMKVHYKDKEPFSTLLLKSLNSIQNIDHSDANIEIFPPNIGANTQINEDPIQYLNQILKYNSFNDK